MSLTVRKEMLRPFWKQLYRNIGYSEHYQRYVVLEPLCYLAEENSSIKCVSVDQIVYPQVEFLGKHIAAYIDREWGDCIEQVLAFNKKYKVIIATDEELLFEKQRLPELLSYLDKNPDEAKKVLGLVHYHVDEPKFSRGDLDAIGYFAAEMKSKWARDQIGIILSEIDPSDSLTFWLQGDQNFVDHLSAKLAQNEIDIIASSFTGGNMEALPVQIKLVS